MARSAFAQPIQLPPSIVDPTSTTVKPAIVLSKAVVGKIFLSVVLSVAALYLIHTGRRDRSVGRLMWGLALALAAFLVF